MAIFVVIPILMVVVYAFSSAGGGFTLDNFARIWDYAVVFTRSFKLASSHRDLPVGGLPHFLFPGPGGSRLPEVA